MTPPGAEHIVALLPMKGHSERVQGKNFKLFHGKPLFRWTLDTLLSVPGIMQVVVNTDARSILEGFGVHEMPRVRLRDRRPEICGDLVSMNRVLEDDINAVPAEIYVMTHTTNPLLSAETIRASLRTFRERSVQGDADSLFTVNRFQTRFYGSDGRPINHDPNNLVRTQDLEPWFEENSNLYVFTRDSFQRTGARIGDRPVMFETPRRESIDIDDAESWEIAERLAAGTHG